MFYHAEIAKTKIAARTVTSGIIIAAAINNVNFADEDSLKVNALRWCAATTSWCGFCCHETVKDLKIIGREKAKLEALI